MSSTYPSVSIAIDGLVPTNDVLHVVWAAESPEASSPDTYAAGEGDVLLGTGDQGTTVTHLERPTPTQVVVFKDVDGSRTYTAGDFVWIEAVVGVPDFTYHAGDVIPSGLPTPGDGTAADGVLTGVHFLDNNANGDYDANEQIWINTR